MGNVPLSFMKTVLPEAKLAGLAWPIKTIEPWA
jgi:hypothetical protein